MAIEDKIEEKNEVVAEVKNEVVEATVPRPLKKICIVHYNTPKLTECTIKSVNKYIKDAYIYVFDNSDKAPFTAKFDNVEIIDNTKGQIVNFDKWLQKYPNSRKSVGKLNNWASAKHCYSVEKCMEIIDDNFVLLDSDVLIKKDFSNLWNDRYIYCGETSRVLNASVKRILPFLCFINVKKCKEKGIHYFNENYMHGLMCTKKTARADYYDTGSAFYLFTNKLLHKDIKVLDYIVHFKGASWVKPSKKAQLSIENFLTKYKKLWDESEIEITTTVTEPKVKVDEKKIESQDKLSVYEVMSAITEEITVSLTSYKERLRVCPQVIKSLLNQTIKPTRICLTLFIDDVQYIPEELQNMIDNGDIELIICDNDLNCHKKYFYAMQKYSDSILIICDDDVLYEKDVIESLCRSYLKHPQAVSARRVHLIKYQPNGLPMPYKKWEYEYKGLKAPSKNLFFTTGAGVLFPPHIITINDENLSEIKEIITASDIYLNYLCKKNGIKPVWAVNNKVKSNPIKDEDIQRKRLTLVNTEAQRPMNDVYLKKFVLSKDKAYKK